MNSGHPTVNVTYRQATPDDVPAIERSRSADSEWGPADPRTAAYLAGTHHPDGALPPRAMVVALEADGLVGYAAGHLSRRFGGDGELQYLWTVKRRRRRGVGRHLLRMLAEWFMEQGATRVCVDVQPDNEVARTLYRRHGALELNLHWMIWNDIRKAEALAVFGEAARAIGAGDQAALRAFLEFRRSLVEAINHREHTLLHEAAASGNAEAARMLLDAGAAVDPRADDGQTPLHFAAADGRTEVCALLLGAGAAPDVDDTLGEGGTPLVQALFYGHAATADLLADRAIAPLNLRVAAGLGRMDLLESLVHEDGTLEPRAGAARTWYRPHHDYPDWSPTDDPREVLDEALCYASQNGRLDAVRFLLDRGANPDAIPYVSGPLHAAIYRRHRPVVELLLDHGADPALRDPIYDGDAMGWADHVGDRELVEHLNERAAGTSLMAAVAVGSAALTRARLEELAEDRIRGEDGTRALVRAIRLGHRDVVHVLREAGASLDLAMAARLGQADEVAGHLARGADPNGTTDVPVWIPGENWSARPISALLAAAIGRHHDVCRMLLDAGATSDVYVAAALGDAEAVEAALSAGHPLDRPDGFRRTILHRAIQGHRHALVRSLLDRGADVGQTADFDHDEGARAIHVAAASGADAAMIDLLLEFGADVEDERAPGTPEQCAIRAGHEQTAELLRRRCPAPT